MPRNKISMVVRGAGPVLGQAVSTYRFTIRNPAVVLVLLLIQLTGCAGNSKPAQFYVLNPIANIDRSVQTVKEDAPTIGIGPISLPKFLDRPEIISRLGPNKVKVDEFNLWAGSLKDNLMQTIVENLSSMVKNHGVVPYPWKKSVGVNLQIKIDIRRFDIDNSNATLIADWSKGAHNELSKRTRYHSEIQIPYSGNGYQTKIAALNLALDQFTQEIALSIE